MTREELEEALDELLQGKYRLTTAKGYLTIVTSLVEDEFGELVDANEDEDEEELESEDEPFVEEDEDDE